MKQNIKKVHDHGFHEKKKIFNLQPNTKIDECGNQIDKSKPSTTNANVTKRYKCHVCDKTLSSKENRTKHIKYIHEKNHAWFNCNKCDKSFYHNSLLNRHLLTHLTEEEKQKCQICSKSYSRPDKLKKHIKTHHE